MTTVLRTRDGGLPKRLADYAFFCGYCFERLAQTPTGATECPNGCPP